MDMYLDDLQVDLEYQGHRSKVRVSRYKNVIESNVNVTLLVHMNSNAAHADRTMVKGRPFRAEISRGLPW